MLSQSQGTCLPADFFLYQSAYMARILSSLTCQKVEIYIYAYSILVCVIKQCLFASALLQAMWMVQARPLKGVAVYGIFLRITQYLCITFLYNVHIGHTFINNVPFGLKMLLIVNPNQCNHKVLKASAVLFHSHFVLPTTAWSTVADCHRCRQIIYET